MMQLTLPDCPLCTGRDTLQLDDDRLFCPWCLHEWTTAGSLIVDTGDPAADDFTADLKTAFEFERRQT
jgi:hypothetical protein